MAKLVLGPLLRYVGYTDATIWVETDRPCEVEVLGSRARTFSVEGHYYAIVYVEGLKSSDTIPYTVALDGDLVWPEPDSPYPQSVIRTLDNGRTLKLAFGSCRVALPHEPPYTLSENQDKRGRESDALLALTLRMQRESSELWPHALLLLGDQVYADEVSLDTRRYIRDHRDPTKPPGETVAGFEEYTRLYWDSWGDPPIRWLLSTVPTAMIFDDHDIHDDWNTSATWKRQMQSQPWWNERIVGGLMSYWIYQHLGNLSPHHLEQDEMYAQVRDAEDAGPLLRRFAYRADHTTEGTRWSYHRDFGGTRLVIMDSRAGRVVTNNRRSMVDDAEFKWIETTATGGHDHLLLGTSLPFILAPCLHHLEAWDEAICNGCWGHHMAWYGEKLRQSLDLEHWAAFEISFNRIVELVRAVGAGELGQAPKSIIFLSGDVHHAYMTRARFPRDSGVKSAVYQAVCSPFRNSLGRWASLGMRAAWSRPLEVVAWKLARLAGVSDPQIRWQRPHDDIWFDNQVATLEIDGPHVLMRIEKTMPVDPRLETVFEHQIS